MARFTYLALFFVLSFVAFSQTKDTFTAFPKDSLVYMRTKGALAYLNYGTGEDRLGGAKMGYLDSLILPTA